MMIFYNEERQQNMEYTVIIHNAEEGGYWAEVPSLEGCFSQGETVEETITNIREAIQAHIMALKEDGIQLPKDQIMILSRVAV
jgi:predicted RNase H-like HicB family nuclease